MERGLFIKGDPKKEVVRFARSVQSDATETDLHIAIEWKGIDVELHYKPSYFVNPVADRKFSRLCYEYDKSTFRFTDNGFCVPDVEFNRVFLLALAFRHYMSEGLGLRQVMDYYFLLRNLNLDVNVNNNLNLNNDRVIEELGMARFEKAMKWVIGYVFEGKDVEDGRKCGKMLLEHIMNGGNFGKHKATTVGNKHTHFGRFIN